MVGTKEDFLRDLPVSSSGVDFDADYSRDGESIGQETKNSFIQKLENVESTLDIFKDAKLMQMMA